MITRKRYKLTCIIINFSVVSQPICVFWLTGKKVLILHLTLSLALEIIDVTHLAWHNLNRATAMQCTSQTNKIDRLLSSTIYNLCVEPSTTNWAAVSVEPWRSGSSVKAEVYWLTEPLGAQMSVTQLRATSGGCVHLWAVSRGGKTREQFLCSWTISCFNLR